jgi:CRISPR-associated protein Csb1
MIDISTNAAIKLRQRLEPIDPGEPVKPPTFAGKERGESLYIRYQSKDGRWDAVLDNAPSQANRIEPHFVGTGLIPQVTVQVDGRNVNLAQVGHRSCDAVVRFSSGAQEVNEALAACVSGNAEPIAKLAPLDILFGSWDSRVTSGATGSKLTRLIRSVIRATDVSEPLAKLGQYRTSIPKDEFTGFSDKQLSEQGILDCPVSGAKDGVFVRGEIIRSAELNLRGIRKLRAATEDGTKKLQQYILGLGLFALVTPLDFDLREGCNLVVKETAMEAVGEDGTRTPLALKRDDVVAFATKSAEEFGVGKERKFVFDPSLAKGMLSGKAAEKEAKGRKKTAAGGD